MGKPIDGSLRSGTSPRRGGEPAGEENMPQAFDSGGAGIGKNRPVTEHSQPRGPGGAWDLGQDYRLHLRALSLRLDTTKPDAKPQTAADDDRGAYTSRWPTPAKLADQRSYADEPSSRPDWPMQTGRSERTSGCAS